MLSERLERKKTKKFDRSINYHFTFSGRLLALAMSEIGRADVFEAKMQCSGTTCKRVRLSLVQSQKAIGKND